MAQMSFLLVCIGLSAGLILADPCSENETANELAAGYDLKGKVAIVTGGDSGLGFAVAEALARQGAAVVIAGHSASKSDAAAHNLSALTGADVRASPVDLGSFASVRSFAAKFLKDFSGKLHYLINDAGISHEYATGGKTVDGFEEVFQVNYLGHFLLTEILLPALRTSSPSRVIHVASEEHKSACAEAGFCPPNESSPKCAKDFTYIPPPVKPLPSSLYGFSKLMMIEHAAELTAREATSGVTAYSLCPGLVVTDMTKEDPAIFKACPYIHQKPCPYNPQQGAAVIAYAALGNGQPGLWYQRRIGCKAGTVVTSGFTNEMRPELYSRSLKMVGLETDSEDAELVV